MKKCNIYPKSGKSDRMVSKLYPQKNTCYFFEEGDSFPAAFFKVRLPEFSWISAPALFEAAGEQYCTMSL